MSQTAVNISTKSRVLNAVYMSKDAPENATFGVRPNSEYIPKCDAVYMTHIKYRILSYSE